MSLQPIGAPDFAPAIVQAPSDVLLSEHQSVAWAPGLSASYGPFNITGQSYAIQLHAEANSSMTNPVCQAVVYWLDAETGNILDTEIWTFTGEEAAFTGGPGMIQGRGPSRASQVVVQIFNWDPSFNFTGWFYLWQSSRVITRADWRGYSSGNAVPGYTVAASDSSALCLAWYPQTALAASNSIGLLARLYAGEAALMIHQSNAQSLAVTINELQPDMIGNPIVYDNEFAGATIDPLLALPRSQCVISLVNNGSASTSVRICLTALEIAS